MKQIIKNYSFNKDTKTVTLTDFTSIQINRLMLITNVTTNTVIYQFNSTALGGTVAGNVVTLTYDTTSMNNADSLQIIYNSGAGDPAYDAPQLDANSNISATLATTLAGENLTLGLQVVEQQSSYTNVNASTQIKGAPGRLKGIFVASASATPTIKVWDSLAASGNILINTFTPAAAQFYEFKGARTGTGIYVEVGGTVDCTVFWD